MGSFNIVTVGKYWLILIILISYYFKLYYILIFNVDLFGSNHELSLNVLIHNNL